MFCLVSTSQPVFAAHERHGHASPNLGNTAGRHLNSPALTRREISGSNQVQAGIEARLNDLNSNSLIPDTNRLSLRNERREGRREDRLEQRLENKLIRNSLKHNAVSHNRNASLESNAAIIKSAEHRARADAAGFATANAVRAARLPNTVGTILDTGVVEKKIDLDLTSTESNIVLGRKLFKDESQVTIIVGSAGLKTYHAGSRVTAAEYVAIRQKLDSGAQLLELNGQGAAIGGEFVLDSVVSKQVDDMVIPQKVSGIEYFTKSKESIGVSGDLTNYGSIIAVATKRHVHSASIEANNLNNESSGLISTSFNDQSIGIVRPGPFYLFELTLEADDEVKNLGRIEAIGPLHVRAGGSITNGVQDGTTHGVTPLDGIVAGYPQAPSIGSRGDITLSSGTGEIRNYGTVVAGVGNGNGADININSSPEVTDVNITATGGTFAAMKSRINVRDASYHGHHDINMIGGDYLSDELNLYSGSGAIEGNVGNVTGVLNTVAGIEHFYSASETLTIGNNCITGDPTFANTTGDINIVGLNTFGEAVAFLANGNITGDANAKVVANGFNVFMIAGANINLSAGPETNQVPGTPIGGGTTATVDFTPGSGNGGNINLTASGGSTVIDTSSSAGNGGNIVLAALANGSTGGSIFLSTSSTVDASSTFTDGNGGNITLLAGASPATQTVTIQTGNISSNAGPGTGTAGDITLATALPTATGGSSVTFDSLGQIIAGGPIAGGTLTTNAQISAGAISNTAASGVGNVSITAGNAITTGAITSANNVTISSGTSVVTPSVLAGGDITINTSLLTNNGTIASAKAGGSIIVHSDGELILAGAGTFSLTGGGTGNILFDAGADQKLELTSSYNFYPGAGGTITLRSEEEGGSINLKPNILLTVNDGGSLVLGTPLLRFEGDGTVINAVMASTITITSGGGPYALKIELPDNGDATIATAGGTIKIEPTDGMDLIITNPGGTGTAAFNLLGGPVETETEYASTFVNSGVSLISDNALTMAAGSAGGISGLGFQPYVGDYFNGNQLPQFNAYDLATVKALLQQLKNDGYTNVATYSQGSFSFGGQFLDPTTPSAGSNKYIIQAAYELGMTVSAGAFQQDLVGDNFDVEKTKAEIQYILDQAQKYPGTVKEIIVCNESIHGVNSANQLVQLINEAKVLRDNTPVSAGSQTKFNSTTLPITTRQIWGVLAGVDSLPNGDPLKPVIKTLVTTVEGHVYGNMYAYFDAALPESYPTGPSDQAAFTSTVLGSMTGTLNAFRTAFSNQGVTTEIRIGETGWPTLGLRAGPTTPAPALANETLSKWYLQAMRQWTASNNVQTTYFQSYDQPWQTVPAAQVMSSPGSSEGYFGLYRANGTGTTTNFTLTNITSKFGPQSVNSIGSNQHMLMNDGMITANSVVMNTQKLDNDGVISAVGALGSVAVNSSTDLSLAGSGTINRTGGGTGGIAFTASGANDILVEGTHTLDAGAGNAVSFNATTDGATFTLAPGASINLPTNNTAFSINAEHVTYNGLINDHGVTNPGTTITFNSADSSTISNSVGDLDLAGVTVNVATGHLALLAKGSIINTGEAASINVSSNVAAGGNVLMIAGYSFQTIDLEGDDSVYALDDVSTSTGSVILNAAGHEINIDTHGATSGGNVEIYSNGSVALNIINATGVSGTGGNVIVRGTDVTVAGAIDNTSQDPGWAATVDIQTGTLTHSGVDVLSGTMDSGTFSLANRSGNITVAAIHTDNGNIILQTDGPNSSITSTNGDLRAHNLSVLAGAGTITIPSNIFTALPDYVGDGGRLEISTSAFTSATPLILIATGSANGGRIVYTNNAATPLILNSDNFELHASGYNGGSATITTGGDLIYKTAGTALDIAPTGANGDGSFISLTAGAAGPGVLIVDGNLNVAAKGSSLMGGTAILNSNGSQDFVVSKAKVKNGVTGDILTGGNNAAAGYLTITNKGGGITLLNSFANGLNTVELSTLGATKGDITIKKDLLAASEIDISLGGAGKFSASLLSAPSITITGGTKAISLLVDTPNLSVNSDSSVSVKSIRGAALTLGASEVNGDFSISVKENLYITGDVTATNSMDFEAKGLILVGANLIATDVAKGSISLTTEAGIASDGPITNSTQATRINLTVTGRGVGLGDIGAPLEPFRVKTEELFIMNKGLTNIANLETNTLTVSKATTLGNFNLTSAGSIILDSKIADAKNITIDTSSGAGDITLLDGLGRTTGGLQITLRTDTGNITGKKAIDTEFNSSITLESNSGSFGTSDVPLTVNTQYLYVTTGGAGTVDLASSNRRDSFLAQGASGGNFTYHATGTLDINNLAVGNGSIDISAARGVMGLIGDITAASSGAPGSGSIRIQAASEKGGKINIGLDALIATSGVGGGDVTIFVGKTPPGAINPLADGPTGHFIVTTSGGGQVFVDQDTVSANFGTINLNAIGKNVYIGGASATNNVEFASDATITADPPINMVMPTNLVPAAEESYTSRLIGSQLGSPVETAAAATHSFNTNAGGATQPNSPSQLASSPGWQSLQTPVEIPSFMASMRNSAVGSTRAHSSAVSAIETLQTITSPAAPEETQFPGNSDSLQEVEAELHQDAERNHVIIKAGNKLFAPACDTTVETPIGMISIAKDSMVLVMVQPDSISVFDLHDEHRGAVKIVNGNSAITLHPGKQATITRSVSEAFHMINPSESFEYRHMHRKTLANGTYLFSSEVSIPSVLNATKTLRNLFASRDKKDRRIGAQLVKTTAILASLDTSSVPFDTMPHPRLTVCHK
jgi:hypothetical protein